MICTGLTEEQVFNSFVNIGPKSPRTKPKSLPRAKQLLELSVHVLDIWSSDDEGGEQIDLWKNEEKKESQYIRKVEEKKQEAESVEVKAEEVESSDGKAKKEEIIASIWELLMHSRDHKEALVLALDQKKISMSYTPK